MSHDRNEKREASLLALRRDRFDRAILHVVSEEKADGAVGVPHADPSEHRQIDDNAFPVRRFNLRTANDIQHLVTLSSPSRNPWRFFQPKAFYHATKKNTMEESGRKNP